MLCQVGSENVNRNDWLQVILQCFEEKGDGPFVHIITGNETWISYKNIEPKQQHMQWQYSLSPKPKMF